MAFALLCLVSYQHVAVCCVQLLAGQDCEEVFGYFEVEFEKMKDQWEAVRYCYTLKCDSTSYFKN